MSLDIDGRQAEKGKINVQLQGIPKRRYPVGYQKIYFLKTAL